MDYLPHNTYFYSSILGGVIFGIGVALCLEWLKGGKKIRGLGLAGAIAINLFGGGTLLFWLIFKELDTPPKGLDHPLDRGISGGWNWSGGIIQQFLETR